MPEAYIVAATRTAGGRKGGKLSGWHPADLGGQVLNALVDKTGVDPAQIEDVILGCVSQVGDCLLYTSPSPRDRTRSRMPSSA